MIEIVQAKQSQRNELLHLLKVCFNSLDSFNDLFLDKTVKYENYIIIKKDGVIVSSVYLFDLYIKLNDTLVPVYYIYAAGTLPEYRRSGFMSLLLYFVNILAKDNGKVGTLLAPSDEYLYAYYKNKGFVEFFKFREVVLSYDDVNEYTSDESCSVVERASSYKRLKDLRCEIFSDNGSIVVDDKYIKFSVDVVRAQNGRVVFINDGYALCYSKDDSVNVTELLCKEKDYKKLLKKILEEMPSSKYIIKVPVKSSFFPGVGEVKSEGMLNIIDKEKLKSIESPYLGLCLE